MPCCLKNNVLRNSGYGVVAHDCDPSTWMAEAKDKDKPKSSGFNRILLWTFSRRSLGVMEGAVGLCSCAFLLKSHAGSMLLNTPLTSFLLPPLSEGCFTFIAEQKGLLQVAVHASPGERGLSALTQGKPPMAYIWGPW